MQMHKLVFLRNSKDVSVAKFHHFTWGWKVLYAHCPYACLITINIASSYPVHLDQLFLGSHRIALYFSYNFPFWWNIVCHPLTLWEYKICTISQASFALHMVINYMYTYFNQSNYHRDSPNTYLLPYRPRSIVPLDYKNINFHLLWKFDWCLLSLIFPCFLVVIFVLISNYRIHNHLKKIAILCFPRKGAHFAYGNVSLMNVIFLRLAT